MTELPEPREWHLFPKVTDNNPVTLTLAADEGRPPEITLTIPDYFLPIMRDNIVQGIIGAALASPHSKRNNRLIIETEQQVPGDMRMEPALVVVRYLDPGDTEKAVGLFGDVARRMDELAHTISPHAETDLARRWLQEHPDVVDRAIRDLNKANKSGRAGVPGIVEDQKWHHKRRKAHDAAVDKAIADGLPTPFVDVPQISFLDSTKHRDN